MARISWKAVFNSMTLPAPKFQLRAEQRSHYVAAAPHQPNLFVMVATAGSVSRQRKRRTRKARRNQNKSLSNGPACGAKDVVSRDTTCMSIEALGFLGRAVFRVVAYPQSWFYAGGAPTIPVRRHPLW